MNEPRLSVLLDQYRHGTLNDEERAELERTLLSSAQAREEFWRHAQFHALLARWGQEEWGRRMAAGPAAPENDGMPSEAQTKAWWRRGGWKAGLAAAACAVLLAAALFQVIGARLKPAGTPGMAVLAQSAGVEWADASYAPGPGTVLAPGWLRLKAGAAQVEFYSGARVIIEGPAEIQVVSDKEVFCLSGRLSARVPEVARGFKAVFPGCAVVDLGTEFGLSVSPGRAPEVHVFAGRVQVSRTDGARDRVDLLEGRAVRVEQKSLASIPASRAGFLSEFDLAQRALADSRRRHEAWREAARGLSRDPEARVHFTFEDEPAWSRVLANSITGPGAGSQGDIVGCQRAEGRWPGKSALQFNSPGDRVWFAAPGAWRAVTLLAWARLDSLPSGCHALMCPDGLAPGTLRWELEQSGRLRLGIARQSSGPEPSWEVVRSEPVVTADRFGQWLLLATVFDGRTVRHYLNGQPAGEGAAFSPRALGGWPGAIGQLAGPAAAPSQRAHGRICAALESDDRGRSAPGVRVGPPRRRQRRRHRRCGPAEQPGCENRPQPRWG